MRLTKFIIAMGFFTILFGCKDGGDGSYRSEQDYTANKQKQVTMAPQTIAQLRKFGVTDETNLKLEYFFYTNNQEKAKSLGSVMKSLGYAGHTKVSASNKQEFVITGWTTRMPMDEATVLSWTASMCDIGKKHDCEFDGWGTNPQQEQ